MKDTARVLGRMFDAIEFRGSGQGMVDELAQYAGVPVYNGLTDEWHPTQMLADLLTMREHADKPRTQIAYAFLGDARNNMGNSLLMLGAMMGMRRAHGRPQGEPAATRTCRRWRGSCRRERRAHDDHRDIDKGGQGRRFRPHRRLGLHGRAEGGLGRADQAAEAIPGQHGADAGDAAIPTSSSCIACPPSTTPRPRSARRWPRSSASLGWR